MGLFKKDAGLRLEYISGGYKVTQELGFAAPFAIVQKRFLRAPLCHAIQSDSDTKTLCGSQVGKRWVRCNQTPAMNYKITCNWCNANIARAQGYDVTQEIT